MKLSIWQQFSSNHSANYMVVGKFETSEKAAVVASEFRKFVLKMFKTTAYPIKIEGQHTAYVPTKVEIAIGQKYGFDWEHGVDWAYFSNPKLYLEIIHDTVWFRNPHWITHQAPVEIIRLFKGMGAEQVAVSGELCVGIPSRPDTALLIDVKCKAPDEEKAKNLYRIFSLEFAEKIIEDRWGLFDEPSRIDPLFQIDTEIQNIFVRPDVKVFEVTYAGQELELQGLVLQDDIEMVFKVLIQYLEKEACTNIEYFFREELTVLPDLF